MTTSNLVGAASIALAAMFAAGPAPGQSDDGVVPLAEMSCKSFLALGPMADAGGSTWTVPAVQRLFYAAYALGVIDDAAPGELETRRKGAMLAETPRRSFQESLLTVDGGLAAMCAWDDSAPLAAALAVYKGMIGRYRPPATSR